MPFQDFRILYVEDDHDTRVLISFLLETAGFEVKSTDSAAPAVALAESERFDLYLLDNWLPDVSGLSLCGKLRELDFDTPILFCSAAAYAEDKQRAFEAGAQGYLTKPIDPEILINEVRRIITTSKRSLVGSEG